MEQTPKHTSSHNSSAKQTPRVVRTGPRSKKRKKPVSKGMRIFKTVMATLGKFLLTCMLVLTITGCIVGTVLSIYVMQYIDSEPEINLTDLKMNYSSMIYALDAEGNYVETQRLYEENRIWVDLKDIPQHVQDAFVYAEDKRFYTHDGVDFIRTFSAVLNLLQKMVTGNDNSLYGGSTITQQLVKNINGDVFDRSYTNKVKEIMQAMNVERYYTKEQILEAYLNFITLGHRTNGVQAAAQYYFNKDVSELTLNEAASLAGTTRNPNNSNPLDNVDDRNDARRRYTLGAMLEAGAITQEEYDANIDVRVTANHQSGSSGGAQTASGVYSYFTDAVLEAVVADLQEEYNYTREEAETKLKTAGWRIYTTESLEVQNKLEEMFVNAETFAHGNLSEEQIPQASMVIIDLEGNVCGLVGGRGEKVDSRGFNRATQAIRAFGSTIKPLSVYAPAFEQGIVNWSTIMVDEYKMYKNEGGQVVEAPASLPEGVELGEGEHLANWPRNYDSDINGFSGPMTIIDALKVSKNTIPVELCNIMSPQYCYNFMTSNFNFPDLVTDSSQIGQDKMVLGSAGTTLLDLVGAYQIFTNGGYYTEPRLYTQVVDANGNVILDRTHDKTKQAISSDTAYILNRALWSVVNGPTGVGGYPSGGSANLKEYGFETIGKTGTSMDRTDLLFVGATPYYIAGIRYGHDDNSVISNGVGSSHLGVWKKVMASVMDGLEAKNFELDDEGVLKEDYCLESGMLAGPDCTKTGVGYYKISTALPPTCNAHGSSAGGDAAAQDSGDTDSPSDEDLASPD